MDAQRGPGHGLDFCKRSALKGAEPRSARLPGRKRPSSSLAEKSNHSVPFMVGTRAGLVKAVVKLACVACLVPSALWAQVVGRYEGRPISAVRVLLEGAPANEVVQNELRNLTGIAPGSVYSAVRVREALQALFDSGRVANARVEVVEESAGSVGLRFIVRPQPRIGEVRIEINASPGAPITEDELRARLNVFEPETRLSEQTLRTNADLIQAYLRDRGFFRATVEYTLQVDPSGLRANVVFRVTPGEQATIEAFNIDINGFNDARLRSELRLQPGAPFTREALGRDLNRIRRAIIAAGYLAPTLDEPRVVLDSARNQVTITLTGKVGPRVNVEIRGYDLSERRRRELLPVLREGTVEYSAIEEGARRLENRLQQEGYFFAEVVARCTVTPPLNGVTNGTPETCEVLDPEELNGRTVNIVYEATPGRRFRLSEIRIEGTDKLRIEDLRDQLRSQEATVLGIIPFLGYGRGYTSLDDLEQDRRLIRSRLNDLGYRKAEVEVRQGVSLDGESLIITFVVTEGPLTRVADIEFRGNTVFTRERLAREVRTVVGGPYSRLQARADADAVQAFYGRNGYLDADVRLDIVELPRSTPDGDERVRLLYSIVEGDQVYTGRIFINGNVRTRREAIFEVIPLREGAVLRADDLAAAERALFATDAFRQVIVRTEPTGENRAGFRQRDVIIDLEERPPRVLDYGFGYSTDNGPLGLFEIQHNNLFGRLQQGALRVRASQRRQLVRIDYFNPRFQRYGERLFAPLTISAQYQRDTSVTRFFRSTIDRGSGNIVQCLDNQGRPVFCDDLSARAGEPSINRFTFNIETRRDFGGVRAGVPEEIARRNTLVLRYSYEDVRLYNIGSLLIADLLRPDRAVRISRLAVDFARDTRNSRIDATSGEYLTLNYSLALDALGGNISFNRFESTYRRYQKFGRVVLAGGFAFGMADLFNLRDRNGNGVIDEADRRLPISERFFAGGATTLRGFGFEEAGPRVVVPTCYLLTPIPANCGQLRDRQGKPVLVNPFTVPIGGNALAVVNLEARIPLTRNLQVIPFYDGGNVFARTRDIFGNIAGLDRNAQADWTHTVGLGFGIGTPFGPLGVDFGYLLNPPRFNVPQIGAPEAIISPPRARFHIRFGRSF